MSKSNIKLVEIGKIGEKNKKFNIPSFQRGYRWTHEHVNDLIDDIYDFFNNNNVLNFGEM
jgi:uncharacterized protein with ParB-like and HNH nuclease domain